MKRIINYIKNYWRLPGPVELGMSDHNALGSREFTPFQDGPMWEDWDEIVKNKHPIKFWFIETAPRKYWWPIKHKFSHKWHWTQCHVMPKKYNFYKINLAGVDKMHPEKYGYVDPCETLKLAAWYCLIRYVEDCKPTDVATWATEEDMKDAGIKAQKADYDEAMFLYNWWTKVRQEEYNAIDVAYLQRNLFNALKVPAEYLSTSKEDYEEVTEEWLKLTREQENKEEEMFLRVCKLRQSLWT